MGLSLEFYAGNPDEIGSAFEGALEGLRDGTRAHSFADLSLHLSPLDLDLLSEQIGAALGRPAVPLLDSLERSSAPQRRFAVPARVDAWLRQEGSAAVILSPKHVRLPGGAILATSKLS